MKKAIVLTLAAMFVLSAFLWPSRAAANTPAGDCFDSYEECRARALDSNQGWFRVAIMLTVCDLALGRCLLFK